MTVKLVNRVVDSYEWPEHTAMLGQGLDAVVLINMGGSSPDWVLRLILLGEEEMLKIMLTRILRGEKPN